MLIQLFVKDFVLIDNMNLDFSTGMSAFTGETGAGKSLLIDAIGILRGDRINTSMVKQGKSKALIEGVFSIPLNHPARLILQEAGYDDEQEHIIIQREFTTDGKSVSRINHRMTTVSLIKEVLVSLLDIHSQHDSQYLLNTKYHLSLLDSYCAQASLQASIKHAYTSFQSIKKELQAAMQNEYNEDDLEFLTFQLNEIDDANIQEEELSLLEEEQRKMVAFEKTSTILSNVQELLNGEQGANTSLYEACRQLESLHEDDQLIEAHDKLLEVYYAMDDQTSILSSYLESMEYDEQRVNEVNERIFLIHKIFRKYGGSVPSILHKRMELEQKIDSILHRSDYIKKQELKQEKAYQEFLTLSQNMQAIRKAKANELELLIVTQLQDLQLLNARFEVSFESIEGNQFGIDQVEFLVSMNKGENLKPLQTTASGGELSRLMLGLKTIFTKLQGIETVIFDEIDTGVSGRVALAIGKKMQALATETQVFCVTHLAQVAACANHHYLVSKHQGEEQTNTDVRELNEIERVEQLALIASDSTSSSALAAAQELFVKAQAN